MKEMKLVSSVCIQYVCVCVYGEMYGEMYRDVQGIDLDVGAAVHGSVHLILGDVEQRAVVVAIRPMHSQHGFRERTRTFIPQLQHRTINTPTHSVYRVYKLHTTDNQTTAGHSAKPIRDIQDVKSS